MDNQDPDPKKDKKEKKDKKKRKSSKAESEISGTASAAVAVSASRVTHSGLPPTLGQKPAAKPAPGAAALDDRIDAKRRGDGPRASQPGAQAVTAGETLNRMEQDVLAKTRAAGGARSSGTATRGAALNQLEQDVIAKTQARDGAASVYSSVGAHSVGAHSTSGGAQQAKSSGRSMQASQQARSSAASGVGAQQALGGSQIAKQPGRSASQSSAARAAAASQVARGGRSSLQNLEDEISAKTRAHDAQQRSSLQSLEADAIAKTRARVSSSQRSSLNTLEDDIVAKNQARGSNAAGVPGAQQATLQQLEDDVAAKGQRRSASGTPGPAAAVTVAATATVGGVATIAARDPSSQAAVMPGTAGSGAYPADAVDMDLDAKEKAFADGLIGTAGEQDNGYDPYYQHPGGIPPSHPAREAAPTEAYPGVQYGSQDGAQGIEAFVADEEYVDATGVAVVMSEEEEEHLERKKVKRYMWMGACAFVAIAAGIVVAIVLTVGQADNQGPVPVVPTVAPSQAPSSAPSFVPTNARMDDWTNFLSPISGIENLLNRTSPQYKALRWISDEDELQLPVGSSRGLQRYFLACFYFALDGDKWIQCGRSDPTCGGDPDEFAWLLSTNNECDWLGVGCNENATIVTSIFFPRQNGNGLTGYLPPETAELKELEALILQRNSLKGTLPTFLGKLKKLVALFLLGNELTGTIPEILLTQATMLGTIHLGENLLTGTIPGAFGSLPLLTLNLAENQLTGSIPSELGQLTQLTYLELQNNNITSSIPEELYNLTNLTRMRLYTNKLQGTLSNRVSRMLELEEFRVGENQLAGSLPAELYELPKIVDFRAEFNKLTGTLSPALANLNNTIRRLYLNDNQMNGPLPIEAIEQCNYMNELILHHNSFTGTISDTICLMKGGRFFDLQNLTVPDTVDCSVRNLCCNLEA